MADKPKSILVYSKQAPKLGYRLVTPLQQPLPTITKTPILPIMGGVNINVPTPVLPSQQRTPINLPMADRLINVPSQVAPIKDKSENKKPLKWGFKGRKETDISELDSDYSPSNPQMENLKRGAKKNKYIADVINRSGPMSLGYINDQFKALEKQGVPRELTGKMLGNNLGVSYLDRLAQKGTPAKSQTQRKQITEDWKRGWLRYYNELTKSQKETFDSLSEQWYGSPNELVDTAKLL